MSAYPNFYPQNYQGMSQNQYQQQPMPQMQYQMPQTIPQAAPQPQSSNGIIWVQGEAAAKSYLVAPNQSVLLMDSEEPTFYIKSSDPSGMPLPLRIFDYTERNGVQNIPPAAQNISNVDMTNYITREEFEEKLASLTSQKKTNSRNKEDITNG